MSKPQPESRGRLNRRTLFAGAGTAGALAAAASLLPGTQGTPEPEASVRPAPERGGGYSLTDHVKQYYKTTRI